MKCYACGADVRNLAGLRAHLADNQGCADEIDTRRVASQGESELLDPRQTTRTVRAQIERTITERAAVEALPYGTPEQMARADAWLAANGENQTPEGWHELMLNDIWYQANRRAQVDVL